MKRVKSEWSLFLYYCFYDFNYETKTVARPQRIVQITMSFLYVSLCFSENAYFSTDAEYSVLTYLLSQSQKDVSLSSKNSDFRRTFP
jgi:hypothetical protein